MAAASGIRSTLQNVTDDQKRWLVFGIALNKVLITKIRPFVEHEILKEYGNLQTSHGIHTQSTAGRLQRWPTFLKYENVNNNDAYPRLPGGKYNYALFDCRVTSHVDFAKLYVENHMAKFNAFDEHCDASAVLNLLGKVPVFSHAVQSAAGDVRQARNAWAHCVFSDWDQLKFQQCFAQMDQLVKALGLPTIDEMDLLKELKDWETKGEKLCMNANIDPDLVKMVQHDVNALKNDVDKLTFEEEANREKIKKALQDAVTDLEELQKRVAMVEHKVSTTQAQISALQSEQEDVQRRVTCLEDQQNASKPQINYEIANCEGDIAFFAGRHDVDTRQWLLKDFDKWFNDPGDSRAYVLLGDAGVGKSVMAGVLAQRSKKAGSLGAAYFCRHNDDTRNDPRCLLGTVACQLCECNSEYSSIVGGADGIRNLLGNYKLGVQELFSKLLQEPLGKCNPCYQKMLVVIDALDETQYKSRKDFLDLIMNRFPMLPKWLAFFLTSRPENTLQSHFKKYIPCVRICAGSVEHHNFYQQHDQDIKLFLRNNVDFSCLPFSVANVANKCNGSFLYAFYLAKDLNVTMQSGTSFQLVDLFPGDFDRYLLENFKRVFAKVGSGLFKKLFGCAIVAPAPLPVSFISFVLQKENSSIDKKHVLDALSMFMVLTNKFAFLHKLIPAWLTDEEKAEELFINRNIEAKYLKDIIIEILFRFIHGESEDVTLIKADLLDYVLSVGIRFLCGLPEKDSLETVFNCLTSFKYIQNRMQSRRIESYSLIEDLRLAADCFLGDGKKGILLGVCSALESNIFVLLECPHLLHVCLQNASEAVQKNIVIPGNMSTTCLQWNSWACPAAQSRNQISPYAVSPDGKLLARGQEKCIFLYDSVSMEIVLGPVKLPSHINHLEFSSDGKFLFYGRLDEWLSVETGCVETFPQFAGKSEIYKWGLITRDQQCIVVKRSCDPESPCCKLCMLNFLCLWATAEIVEDQESTTICGCFPDKMCVRIRRFAWAKQDSPVPAMISLLNVLKRSQHKEWCRLLKKFRLNYPFEIFDGECGYCASRKHRDTPNLATVRDFIINHYSMIFEYQIWDVQAGVSVLERAFSSDIQMSSFTYFCHLGRALEECGVLFSGIDKALSLCNIALVNTVFHHLIFFKAHSQKWDWLVYCDILWKRNDISMFPWHTLNSNEFLKFLEALNFTNAPLELQNLPDAKRKGGFINMLPCVSPDGKWVAVRFNSEATVILYRKENQLQHNVHWRNPLHVIKEVERFAFTYDGVVFLYLTKQESLHALSLQTGTILTSVSGVRPLFLIPETETGYSFRAGDEDVIIYLKDFPRTFLWCCFIPVLKKPSQASFALADTILVLCSDSVLTVMKTKDDGSAFTTASKTLLRSPDCESQQVMKCQFSKDGKLIVTHQGTKILLYATMLGSTYHGKCVALVYEREREFNVVHFTFSADNTLLLFCILQGNYGPYFFVWNVEKNVVSASFDSPRVMSENCCCFFSSGNKELGICAAFNAAFYIEFWDHTARPCRLLRKVETDVPCMEADKVTYCTVSQENDLLASCIVDRIILYPLSTATDQSILQLPRAHLGKIEFCQFLRGNRHLISFGVDGMVFLWDLSEWKTIAYAKIAQGRESIVSMAVCPKENKVVCVTSFMRLIIIKLCGLKTAMVSLPKARNNSKMTKGFFGQVEPTAAIQSPTCSANTDISVNLDVAKRIEEMDFMFSSDVSDDSEPDDLQD